MASWVLSRRKLRSSLRLDQRGDELGGPEEADLVALGARFGRERRREVGLAGAGVADQEHVLALVDELAAGELGDQHLVDRRSGGEVEALEGLDGREPGGLQPSLGRLALPLEQLELAELQQVGEVIGVVGRGLGGDLLGFGTDRREPQRLEVVAQAAPGTWSRGASCMLLSRSACA